MRHSTIPFALAVWAVATFAGAQLSQEYKDWPDTPAGYLLTKAERKAFADLKTDAEAKAFIELFWAKRDPNLDTPVNEFKADFDARVDAADKYFAYGSTKGSMSDRGRILIVLGKYSQRLIYRPGELPAESIEQGRREANGGNEVWKYSKAQLPKDVTKLDTVTFIFSETHPGTGDFIFDRSDPRNAMASKVLADTPDVLLLHPKLTEVPRLGMLPGSKGANAQQLAVLGVEPRPWPQGSAVMGAPGTLNENLHPYWLYIQLPDGVPAATDAIGRASSADTGKEAGTFIVPVKPVTTAGGSGYEFAFPLDPGAWKLEVALTNASGPIAVTSYDATVEAVPREGTLLSPLYWGVDVRQEAQARLGVPFNIGGWHVLPRVNNTYTPSEQLSYFCFIIRPGLPEQAAPPAPAEGAAPAATPAPPRPKFEISIQLFDGDKKITEVAPTPVNLSEIRGDLWMFGNGLPLQGLRKPGNYKLVVTLHDTITNASRTTSIPVTMAAAEPAAPKTGT